MFSSHELAEWARLSRIRAQKCRELSSLLEKPEAVESLRSYADELDSRAYALESQAAAAGVTLHLAS